MRVRTTVIALLALVASGVDPARTARAAPGSVADGLVVVRGNLQERLVLTGELDSVSADNLVVPRTTQWQLQLRWLELDGTLVVAGQPVAEFDNSAFVTDLSDKKLSALQAATDLDKQRAQDAMTTADKAFEVSKALNLMEKARASASIAKDSLPARDWQENQLEFERQQTAYAKAKDDLQAQTKGAALDVQVKQIALDKSLREIHAAEKAINDLVLRAPRDGIVVIANNPWEGRKFQESDAISVGETVVRMPDLTTMRIKALLADVDDGHATPGMRAKVTLDAYPDRQYNGVVREISPVAREPSGKSQRRSFQVVVSLSDTDRENALPGLSAKVEVAGRAVENVLFAPRSAIDFETKPQRLRTAHRGVINVDVGLCDAQRCEVTSHGDAGASDLVPGLPLREIGAPE